MNSDEAWSRLNTVTDMTMRRWTAVRPGYKSFKLERQGDAEHAVYQIIITDTGREPRWFDRARFNAFWKLWTEGRRNPNDYRNTGPAGGLYKHAYYMLPIAAALETGRDTPETELKREFKYGEKQTWQMAVDALRALGGTATIPEVEQYLSIRHPSFNLKNVRPDLDLVSVNAFSRANWSPNQKARVIDGSNSFDLLFVETLGIRTYTFYEPEVHGIWELAAVPGDTKLRPQRLDIQPTEAALDALRDELESEDEFDPDDDTDARTKTLGAIARRQGQMGFRKSLLKAYAGRCAFTGCDVEQALEAAHIRPYLGAHTNVVVNGLLLRSDLHTLFDLRLVRINPGDLKIEVSTKLKGDYYQAIAGKILRLPLTNAERPSLAALNWHWNACALNFPADCIKNPVAQVIG